MLPQWVRRVVLDPAIVLITGFVLLSAPLILLVGLALTPLIPGRWRPLRFLWFVVLYLIMESGMLVALFGVWLVAGFGARIDAPWSQHVHYRMLIE